MDEKVKNLNNNYSYKRKILKNKLENSINIILNNNNINKNLIINKINSEYNSKLKELNNEYDNKLKEIKKEQEEKNKKELEDKIKKEHEDKIKKEQEEKKQYNLENYDLLYDSKFDEMEVENILKDLIEKNISHIKKWDNKFNSTSLPNNSSLIEIKDGIINTLYTNKHTNYFGDYEFRYLPFIEFLKKINLENIDVKFILIYQDHIYNAGITEKPNYDIPIFCSSISDDCKKIYNNLILIPNMYFYNDTIPIKQVKMLDIDYKDKSKSINFSGLDSNLERKNFAKWTYEKNNSLITCNLSAFFNMYEIDQKYYNKFLSLEEQLKNKLLVSLDGCSTAWNGLLWKLYSNSLVLKLNQEYYEYWYSLLDMENIIFKCDNFDEMANIMESIDDDSELIKEMHKNKKKVAKLIMDDDFNKRYLREILLNLTKIVL
jgi:hypothetical protein